MIGVERQETEIICDRREHRRDEEGGKRICARPIPKVAPDGSEFRELFSHNRNFEPTAKPACPPLVLASMKTQELRGGPQDE